MPQQTINIGLAPNDGAGDPIRTAFEKCNDNFDELYAVPPGGSGTVTTVSVVNANGVSATVSNPTTTPALTVSLGNIVPAKVNGITFSGSSTPSLAVNGVCSVTNTNSGDVTLVGTPDYLTIAGQTITRGLIDLSTDVTGVLPATNGGTGTSAGMPYSSIGNIVTNRILGRTSSGIGAAELLTITNVFDLAGAPTQGAIHYRGSAAWSSLNAGTNGQFLKTQGAGANPVWASIPTPAASLWIGADEFKPRISDGCGTATVESATHKVNTTELLFDQSTDEFAQATVVMPSNYNGGTITAKFHWSASSGSGDVVWYIQGRSFPDGANIDQAFGAAQTVTDTLTAANQVDITAATPAITLVGTATAGNLVIFQIWRDANAGTDTLTADARLLGVEISYTAA